MSVQAGLLVAAIACAGANAFEVAGKVAGAAFVLRNSDEAGVDRKWIPHLAALEGAGAAGVVLGLLGVRLIGLAAAVGLVLYFIGAVTVHVRARVFHNIAWPLAFLLLAAAAAGYFAWSAR